MSPAHRFLHADNGGAGFTLPAPAKMHPSEIALTLSADVLRLPLKLSDRVVLAEIVSLHAATGCCDASDPHFAARLGLNKDTVSVAVGRLETEGLIRKVVVNVQGGKYRTLTPNPAAIAAKAATNPYPEVEENTRRKFRPVNASQTGNSGVHKPEIPAAQTGISGLHTPEIPVSQTGNSGGNIPVNIPIEISIPTNDAACAAAAGSGKKIEPEISSAPLPAAVVVSAPPVAAAPPAKLQLMRTSSVATLAAFVQAWQAAVAANPDAYTDFLGADLPHYHGALLDWSDANGKKKLDWLATIRASMRSDVTKGLLRRLTPSGAAASSPVLKRLATAEAAFAMNDYDEAGNRLN